MPQKIIQHLKDHDQQLTEEGMGIYGRWYIATTALLAYCSVLRFSFNNVMLARGWLDVLIIGDTRCGKSAIVEGITRGIRLGEFCKGENTTFAGLIGGLQQLSTKSKWDLVWGKLPLNSGKLLVIDEASSLAVDDIGNMSAVRSSGIAEIVKVTAGTTCAQTRLIWMSNPRSEVPMASYSFGVEAIKELVGRPEDISRFDFAIGVLTSDVPTALINSIRTTEAFQPKWDELRNLVMWVWSLKPVDVVFDTGAVEAIMSLSEQMSKEYISTIPLVEPNEQRVRVARVSVAMAARCFSEQGGKLIITPRHVEATVDFMRQMYNAPALNYARFGRVQRGGAGGRSVDDAVRILLPIVQSAQYADTMLLQGTFSTVDLEAIFNVTRAEGREMVSTLLKERLITRGTKGYIYTKNCVAGLQKIAEGGVG